MIPVLEELLEKFLSGRMSGAIVYATLQKLKLPKLQLREYLEDAAIFIEGALNVSYARDFGLTEERASEVRFIFDQMAFQASQEVEYEAWESSLQELRQELFSDLSPAAVTALCKSTSVYWIELDTTPVPPSKALN